MVLHPRLLALLGGVTLALALLWGAGVFSPQQAHAQSNDSIPKDYDKRFWEIVKWSKDSSDPARQQASKDALKSAGHKAAPVLNTVGKGLTVIGAGQIWYHNYIQLKPFFNDGTSTTVTMDQETGPAPGTITANFYGRTGQRTGHLILKRFKYAVDASGTATMQWEWIAGISAWEKTNSCGLATGWSYVGYGGSYAVAKATGYTDGSGPVPAFKVSACQKTDTPSITSSSPPARAIPTGPVTSTDFMAALSRLTPSDGSTSTEIPQRV